MLNYKGGTEYNSQYGHVSYCRLTNADKLIDLIKSFNLISLITYILLSTFWNTVPSWLCQFWFITYHFMIEIVITVKPQFTAPDLLQTPIYRG